MSGHWPPEWEDPEGEFPEEAGELDTEAEARLSEVAAYLASVPAPALPDAVEARISTALAAEATARADHAAPADSSRRPEPSSRAPARDGRHRGGGGPRRGFRLRPATAVGSLVGCLLLAGLGYALSRSHVPETTYSSSAAAPAAGSSAAGSSAAGSSAEAGPAAPSAAAPGPESLGTGSSFAVTASGTRYEQATLAGQVRSRLAANGVHDTSGTTVPAAGATVPAASASAASAAVVPSPALRGCVLRLTGGAVPRLVDRATYRGEPAYVIASSSRVWVVGLGCTAAKPELVASVPLAG